MTSRASFFEPAIFRRDVKKSAPLWALYLVVLGVLMPMSLYASAIRERTEALLARELERVILQAATGMASFIPFIYGLAIAWVLFFFLFKTSQSYLYGGLPVRRETLFSTKIITGLFLYLAPTLLVTLASFLITCYFGCPQPVACLQFFAAGFLGFLFFFGFAVLCACMIGHPVAMPIFYGILNVTAALVTAIFVDLMDQFVYGLDTRFMDSSSSIVFRLSPIVDMVNGRVGIRSIIQEGEDFKVMIGYEFNGMGYLGIIAAVGVVFLLLSLLLLRRRDLERSGDVITVPALRPVFRYAFTIGCALVLRGAVTLFFGARFAYGRFVPILILLFVGAAIGWFGASMMLKKTMKVFSGASAWAGLCAVCLLLFAVCGAMRYDLFGYSSKMPDPENVKTVTLDQYVNYVQNAVEDPEYLQKVLDFQSDIIRERSVTQAAIESGEYSTVNACIKYVMHDGSEFSRCYTIPIQQEEGSLFRRFENLYNDPELLTLRNRIPDEVFGADAFVTCQIEGLGKDGMSKVFFLNGEDAYDFYQNYILPDLKDGNIGKSRLDYTLPTSNDLSSPVFVNFIMDHSKVQFAEEIHSAAMEYEYRITSEASRTCAFLSEQGFSFEPYG